MEIYRAEIDGIMKDNAIETGMMSREGLKLIKESQDKFQQSLPVSIRSLPINLPVKVEIKK